MPETDTNNGSASESLPSPQRIPEFQPAGRQRQLAKAENWFRNHSPTLTGVVVPVLVGFSVGFGANLFTIKYQREVFNGLKQFVAPYLPSNRQPGPVKSGMDQLLDYAEGVMNRASDTYQAS